MFQWFCFISNFKKYRFETIWKCVCLIEDWKTGRNYMNEYVNCWVGMVKVKLSRVWIWYIIIYYSSIIDWVTKNYHFLATYFHFLGINLKIDLKFQFAVDSSCSQGVQFENLNCLQFLSKKSLKHSFAFQHRVKYVLFLGYNLLIL